MGGGGRSAAQICTTHQEAHFCQTDQSLVSLDGRLGATKTQALSWRSVFSGLAKSLPVPALGGVVIKTGSSSQSNQRLSIPTLRDYWALRS
jgi:hypothetical protein